MSIVNKIIKEDIFEIVSELGNKVLDLQGKNILITGASGMLASYMVYVLIYLNENVFEKPCNLYLLMRSKNDKFGDEKFIHYIYGDISKSKPIIKEKIHYIIHAASKSAPKIYLDNMIDTLNTNIKGLYNILDLVNKETKSILFFSSGEVYGQIENIDQQISENYIGKVDHLGKRSCYAEGKRASETICMNYFWERNFPIKIARIFHTFGPGLNLDDGRVFSDFIKMGLEGKNIDIKGNKSLERPFLYIKDATIMFFLLLLSSKNGEVYNISNNKEMHSVGEVAKLVTEIINKCKKINIKVLEKKTGDLYMKDALKSIKPNTNKFAKDFKYIPKTTLKESLSKTILSCIDKD